MVSSYLCLALFTLYQSRLFFSDLNIITILDVGLLNDFNTIVIFYRNHIQLTYPKNNTSKILPPTIMFFPTIRLRNKIKLVPILIVLSTSPSDFLELLGPIRISLQSISFAKAQKVIPLQNTM